MGTLLVIIWVGAGAITAFLVGFILGTYASTAPYRHYRDGFEDGRAQGRQETVCFFPASDSDVTFDGEGGWSVTGAKGHA